MISAGMRALEQENPLYEPDFVIEYRNSIVIPRIKELLNEQKLAEQFDPFSDVPKKLIKDGWPLEGLKEQSNLHFRELVDGLLLGKTPEEALSHITEDRTSQPRLSRNTKNHL